MACPEHLLKSIRLQVMFSGRQTAAQPLSLHEGCDTQSITLFSFKVSLSETWYEVGDAVGLANIHFNSITT